MLGSADLKFSLTNFLGVAEMLQLRLEVGKGTDNLLDVFSTEQVRNTA